MHCVYSTGLATKFTSLSTLVVHSSLNMPVVHGFIPGLNSRTRYSNTVRIGVCIFFPQKQSYLLANLAVSDFIMGAYLLLMAGVDVHYRGDYARHDLEWKQSQLCKVAGFLSTLSGELSVLTLIAITIERFVVIAINSPVVTIGMRQVKMMVLVIWVFVLTICLVPCFDGSYFNNYYGQSEMCLPIPIASDRQTGMKYSSEQVWHSLEDGRRFAIWRRTAKPIISARPNGWEFSVFVFVCLNGMAFLAILFMYLWMFRSIKKTRAAARSTTMKADLALARKMIIIVGTDALCWFPVIGLGIYCLVGNTLGLQVSCHHNTNSHFHSSLGC